MQTPFSSRCPSDTHTHTRKKKNRFRGTTGISRAPHRSATPATTSDRDGWTGRTVVDPSSVHPPRTYTASTVIPERAVAVAEVTVALPVASTGATTENDRPKLCHFAGLPVIRMASLPTPDGRWTGDAAAAWVVAPPPFGYWVLRLSVTFVNGDAAIATPATDVAVVLAVPVRIYDEPKRMKFLGRVTVPSVDAGRIADPVDWRVGYAPCVKAGAVVPSEPWTFRFRWEAPAPRTLTVLAVRVAWSRSVLTH